MDASWVQYVFVDERYFANKLMSGQNYFKIKKEKYKFLFINENEILKMSTTQFFISNKFLIKNKFVWY